MTQNFSTTGELGEEYQKISDSVRAFADDVVAPVSAQHDRDGTFPYEVVSQMAEMGLFGLPFPTELGGVGKDFLALCLAIEQLGRVNQSVAVTLEAGICLGAMPIFRFGTDEQVREWIPRLATGSALAGFGLTEVGAGSDASGTETTARVERGEWVIDGTKQFITNSGTDITELVTVIAVTGESQRDDGTTKKELSTIVVPVPADGFTVEPGYDKVGWNSSDTHPLTLTGVRAPEANLLGERGRGFANFVQILDAGRIAVGAIGVGAAQGCVDESVRYAKRRRQFGRSIGENQAISFKIARMQARAHTARLAYYDAASRMVAGKPFKAQASIAKLVGGEAAMDNARDATQIFGGLGFMNDSLVARHYRDSKILEIGEGTTEVQLMLIAREFGL